MAQNPRCLVPSCPFYTPLQPALPPPCPRPRRSVKIAEPEVVSYGGLTTVTKYHMVRKDEHVVDSGEWWGESMHGVVGLGWGCWIPAAARGVRKGQRWWAWVGQLWPIPPATTLAVLCAIGMHPTSQAPCRLPPRSVHARQVQPHHSTRRRDQHGGRHQDGATGAGCRLLYDSGNAGSPGCAPSSIALHSTCNPTLC